MGMKRRPCIIAALILSITMTACETSQQREAKRAAEERRLENDRNSAAFKSGQMAHEIARRAEQAAAAAGRKLNEDARKAREGWKEQERKDRQR